jgi:A/G-specific adenine glycosylase
VFSKRCKAFQAENVSFYPVKAKAKARKVRHFNYFVFRKGNKIWMQQRTGNDVWQGLHEFYLVETNRAVSDKKVVTLFPTKMLNGAKIPSGKKIRQILSHQKIEGKFFEIAFADVAPAILKGTKGNFYSLKEIESLAKPVLVNKFLES